MKLNEIQQNSSLLTPAEIIKALNRDFPNMYERHKDVHGLFITYSYHLGLGTYAGKRAKHFLEILLGSPTEIEQHTYIVDEEIKMSIKWIMPSQPIFRKVIVMLSYPLENQNNNLSDQIPAILTIRTI